MKKLNLPPICAAWLGAATLAGQATVFFSDNFSSGSTLNSLAPAAPTANSTSYQLSSSKSWVPTPSIGAGDLKFGIASSTSGGIELQALFTQNPVALVQIGDFVRLTVTFTNTAGIQTANCLLGFGLYNASQVAPLSGGLNGTALNSNTDKVSGGVQNWQGYWGQRGFTGQSSRIVKRLPQTTGVDNRNQNLTSTGSGSQSYGSPAGATVGSTSTTPSGALTVGNTYTVVLRIDKTGDDALQISNTYYNGPDTNGTVVAEITANPTGADVFTTSFDGIGIGWRAGANSTGGTVMDISSILVDGTVTTISSPPDILSQPASVIVPVGGSCIFNVQAQGFALGYQWYRYGTNLVDGNNISGSKTDTLVISPTAATDVASGANGYYVVVSGAGGFSTNSAKASLTLGTASSLVWSGTGVQWDLGVSPSFLKGASPAVFNYGDSVTFNNSGVGNPMVTLIGNYLAASTVTVDTTFGNDYVFDGTGSIAGPARLIYSGAGLLTIKNPNTHTGGTIISNSSAYLVLSSYAGLGNGPVHLAKAGGLIEVVPTGGAANGFKGDVIVEDDFTIRFDGPGAYSGVFLGNLAGTIGKTLTLNTYSTAGANRIRVYGSATTYDGNLVLQGVPSLEAAYTGTTLAPYHGSGAQVYNGVISGDGGIIQRAGGITVLAGQNTYAGGTTPSTGTIGLGANSVGNVTSGPIGTGPLYINPEAPNLTGSGTVLAFGVARTVANPIQYSSGTNNFAITFGGTNDLTFTGPYTLNGNDKDFVTATYTLRTNNVSNTGLTTLAGSISGTGWGLVKTGNGTLVLGGNSSYDGQTIVSAGALRVNGTVAGALSVSSGGTLEGTGTIAGATTLASGSTLSPGAAGIGTLTINNSLSLAGNLVVQVNKGASPNADKTVVSGALANTGTGTITVSNLGSSPAVGDTFALFNKAVTGGSGMTVTGGGVTAWNNRLEIDGTISVASVIANNPTNITYSVSGNNLTLNWPQSHQGWILQSNAVGVASSASWYAVPNSETATQVVIPINRNGNNVFFRLSKP